MECITEVRKKEDGLGGFVGRSPLLVHEPSGEPSDTRAPGDNVGAGTGTPVSSCSTSADVLPKDGHGSDTGESRFPPLLPQKASPNTAPVADGDPPTSTGTASHVAAEWSYAHTRRPRRSFPADFKLKAVAYYRQGNTKAATAKFFGIHRKRIQEWIQQESVLTCSPSNKRRMTQTMVAASKTGKGEEQSGGSVEGKDGSALTPSEPNTSMNLSQSGTFMTHIQTLPTLPVVASEGNSGDSQVPAGSATALPTSGGMLAGREDALKDAVSVEAHSGDRVMQHRHTTPPIPPSHTISSPITLAHTSPSCTPPSHTTLSPAQNVPSQSPSSKATLEDNITFLKTLTDETVGTLLDAMNLSKYKAKFLAEQVDGELLSSLGQSELRELGIESGLHQLKLLKLIQGNYSAETFLRKVR